MNLRVGEDLVCMEEKKFLEMLEDRVSENTGREGWGRFNGFVRYAAEWLGVHPWRVMGPVSVLVALGLAVVFRGWLVRLVEVLQAGW